MMAGMQGSSLQRGTHLVIEQAVQHCLKARPVAYLPILDHWHCLWRLLDCSLGAVWPYLRSRNIAHC